MTTTTMKPLPSASQASVADGLWFVFHDHESIIRAWSSALAGNEQIYFNEQRVSTARRFKKTSEHLFPVDGNEYRVVFTTESIMQGQLTCEVYKNDHLLGSAQCRYIKPANLAITMLLALAAAGLAVGVIGEFNYLPKAFYYSTLAILTPIYILTRRNSRGHFVIEHAPIE